MPNTLKNISIATYRKFLKFKQCKYLRTEGGHEFWTRSDLLRPICFQTHIDPIPERILKQSFQPLGIDKKEFLRILNKEI